MTQQQWPDDKFIELWLMAENEPIGDEGRSEFNRRIIESPHLRQQLVHLAQEQSWLMWHGTEAEASPHSAKPLAESLRAGDAALPLFGGVQRFRSTAMWTVTATIAVSVLTIALIARWPVRKQDLANSVSLKWPLKSSVLKIESGLATLDLPNVGHLVLEGPAEMEMLDPMTARLKQGRIRVRVTEATGRGFVVEYPDGKVTDLGTEFGLEVPLASSGNKKTSLVVFDGTVDLERTAATKQPGKRTAERLRRGEGVTFESAGDLDRIMSIVTGKDATFQRGSNVLADRPDAVILDVRDNLRTSETRKFYEIVPSGFGEDVLAYADRPAHEWNGVTPKGLPRELIGADYVKTFSDDDMRTDVDIRVTLGRPAQLYVFFDATSEPPAWLRRDFRKTKDKVGMDLGPWPEMGHSAKTTVGPGKSIDHQFAVWVRTIKKPGVVTLGANRVRKDPYMYGIAAVAFDAADANHSDTTNDDVTPLTHLARLSQRLPASYFSIPQQ
ncbi:MAG: FecR domain-containing protein [Pirellulales bacterium]|nr:FecR domain-containing protein [Pirellulales bacterium]